MRKKRQLDDPRTLGEPVKGAVVFAFGMVGPGRSAIPGPALVAILGALGFGEPTARATILRMRRDGRLTSTRRGPVVLYELTAPSRALSDEVLRPVVGEGAAWDGVFHALLFSIPERGRAYRDALRRTAVLAGFGLLQPGVFVTTDARRWARIEPLLQGAPAGSRLMRGELRLTLADARAAAAEAWPLGELGRRYREQIAQLERVAAECRAHPPIGALALRTLWEAMALVFGTAVEDPALPAELLPADWPGDEIRQSVAAASMALGPAAQAYLRNLMPEAGA
ncbi:MAG: PaaX family transcriptional regulator C-terminal domain-containing protein [Candidatus Limnocylindrales bacterium]